MIHVVTDPATGGTFLTWSIYYLSGHSEYFLSASNRWMPLSSNPLSKTNAHKFIPNQPNRIFDCSPEQFLKFSDSLTSTPSDTPHILYFHSFDREDTTQAAVNYSNNQASKLIVVDTADTNLYHCSYRKRAPQRVNEQTLTSDDFEIYQHFINKFFKGSKQRWDELGLDNTWDFREFLALNFRPFEVPHIYDHVDKTRDHYLIRGKELWTSMDLGIATVFEYLGIGIDQTRLENWQQIYNNWKSLHYQRLMFSTYFEDIVDGILNNYSIDLLRFDLDIEQEAAIQHALIYRHNLNLKTWQLEKFVNTTQLHNLLEPNIHPLSS